MKRSPGGRCGEQTNENPNSGQCSMPPARASFMVCEKARVTLDDIVIHCDWLWLPSERAVVFKGGLCHSPGASQFLSKLRTRPDLRDTLSLQRGSFPSSSSLPKANLHLE
jgi:hypothetical protein